MANVKNLICGRFKTYNKLGEGTFGVTFLSKDFQNGGLWIALKKTRVRNAGDGLDYNTIQEIRQLTEISHPNIVHFIGAFSHENSLYLATELLPANLKHMIYLQDPSQNSLTEPQIKCIMRGIFLGVEYLHTHWILHRDIKPENVMLTNKGVVKLIDFGLSADYPSDVNTMINEVITLHYRPPEILFGATRYGPAVDCWSVGCLFAELFLLRPFFHGRDDNEQLQIITDILGPTLWPGCDKLPNFRRLTNSQNLRPLKDFFPSVRDDAIDLLSKLLTIDPSQRMTATEALNHPYFLCPPQACLPSELPLPPEQKEYSNLRATSLTASTIFTSRQIFAPGTTLMERKTQ